MEDFVKMDLEDVKDKRKKFAKADSSLSNILVKQSELKQNQLINNKAAEVKVVVEIVLN